MTHSRFFVRAGQGECFVEISCCESHNLGVMARGEHFSIFLGGGLKLPISAVGGRAKLKLLILEKIVICIYKGIFH